MIRIENTETFGWKGAVRGMRNPLESWEKSDSVFEKFVTVQEGRETTFLYPMPCVELGKNDLDLMMRLRNAGSDDRKFMRMIHVQCDITAPLYWWKEYDTYKVGTVANSTSTMHKIHSKEFSRDDFSCDRMSEIALTCLDSVIVVLEERRRKYIETKDTAYWHDMIQLLPSSYNQMRTCTLNYENLINIYYARRYHKLPEWHVYCDWIASLPYATELITSLRDKQDSAN